MIDATRIKRLQDAVEGECEGLAISPGCAAAILHYVDTGKQPMIPFQAEFAAMGEKARALLVRMGATVPTDAVTTVSKRHPGTDSAGHCTRGGLVPESDEEECPPGFTEPPRIAAKRPESSVPDEEQLRLLWARGEKAWQPAPADQPERPSADWRRLTALWRFGVAVLPPTIPNFYAWLNVLDAAIDERTRRGPATP